MSLEIYVDSYSGYMANERPPQFILDEGIFEIEAVENQWRSPEAEYFKVRTTDGKHYVLRYHDERDQWTLQSDFNGAGLFARTSIQLVNVEPVTIREAEYAGCEQHPPQNGSAKHSNWQTAVATPPGARAIPFL